jgi:exopolysaccharide biosynthesis polyprenyl glycosylphosphotransferase
MNRAILGAQKKRSSRARSNTLRRYALDLTDSMLGSAEQDAGPGTSSNTPAALMRALCKPAAFPVTWVLLLFVSDLAAFLLATVVATELVLTTHPILERHLHTIYPVLESSAMIILFQLLILERVGLYRRSFARSLRDEFYYACTGLAIGALPLLVVFTLLPRLSSSRLIIIVSLIFSMIGIGGTRVVIRLAWDAAARRRPRRIAIVGRHARTEAAAISLNLQAGAQLLRIDIDDLDESMPLVRIFESDLSEVAWFSQARSWGCDTLMLTEALPPAVLPVLLHVAARSKIKLALAPPRFRVHAYSAHLEIAGEQALLVLGQLKACTLQANIVKRIFDVIFASLVLVMSAPLLACCGLAILLESPGPLLYRQERVGRNGKPFQICKLRSMHIDAEAASGPIFATRRDSRTTKVGRFLRRTSLDELPQFINVLRGEMSIVGPRPERSEFVAKFRDSIARYDERHLVRPGITGWSQVNLQRALTPSQIAEKLSYDLFYIEQWSLFLDLSIVAKTALEFLFHDAT